jgi:hypothetical protein
MSNKLLKIKQLEKLKTQFNQTAAAQSMARKMQTLAGKQKNDISANTLSRIGAAMESFNMPYGPKTLSELAESAGVADDTVIKAIKYTQKN